MSTSFSRGPMPRVPLAPITTLQYRDTTTLPPLPRVRFASSAEPETRPRAEVEMTETQLHALLAEARHEGAVTAEKQMREQASAARAAESGRITAALDAFERERKGYFARVETEVVRLALSIAAKILHREAQVEPMLVAALVQIALDQLRENTAVNIRVHPAGAARWRAHFEAAPQWASVRVVEDAELDCGDCFLETELGSANFSLAAQLKEVEQGFFDILAQTPKG